MEKRVEQWTLKVHLFTAANFNDLDYASNDVVDIHLTLQIRLRNT